MKTINLQLNEPEKELIEQYIINKIAAVERIQLPGYKLTSGYYKIRLKKLKEEKLDCVDIFEYIDMIDCKEMDGITNNLHQSILEKIRKTKEYKKTCRNNEMYFKRQKKYIKIRRKHNKTDKHT